MFVSDEAANELLAAENQLSVLANHAANVHGAICVADALAGWFVDLLSWLFTNGVVDNTTIERIIAQNEARFLIASLNDPNDPNVPND